ncbi:uncharacterized protein LOC113635399 [Tachysurus ichikawai]
MEWTSLVCLLTLFFYPRHGLLLLHWLANHISISRSEDILRHFDPARQDYGFRYYRSSNSSFLPYLDDSSVLLFGYRFSKLLLI